MLLVQWIKPPTKDQTDFWIEVNSQILNGCFTLSAIIVAPSRMLNLWRLIMYLFAVRSARSRQAEQKEAELGDGVIALPEKAVKLANELERVYSPLLIRNDEETRRSMPESVFKVALVPEGKWLALILILNGQCFFQWPITVAMWGWASNYPSRPGFMVYAFLPISFICSAWGGIWLGILGNRVTAAKKKLEVAGQEELDTNVYSNTPKPETPSDGKPKAAPHDSIDAHGTMTDVMVESVEDVAPTSVLMPPTNPAPPPVASQGETSAVPAALERFPLNTQKTETELNPPAP
ncbi:hypothetical protein HDU67_009038 [Dinochytrium kinnereticum]|nr:hypothetical protein HDU67_009038 [Dinochytrium kinnereticum]